MKKLDVKEMEALEGGICTTPPNPNFPFPCFDACQIALIASGGNAPFVCIL